MSEKTEITFMQTRLIRLASEEWHLPVEQIIHLFKEADVLGYIEKCYEIFHCEGDEAVLEDITEFLQGQKRDIDRFSMFKDRKSTVWWEDKVVVHWPGIYSWTVYGRIKEILIWDVSLNLYDNMVIKNFYFEEVTNKPILFTA